MYSCQQCSYKATQQSCLKSHQQSVHKGVKYSCNQCKYQATSQSSLKIHQQSIHDGVKYFCDQCEYQAGQKTKLKRQIITKHSLLVETVRSGKSSIAQENTADDHDGKSNNEGDSNHDIPANGEDDAGYQNEGRGN